MLQIKNLNVSVAGHAILRGIDLTIKPGEVHAIMGPNGSGKSTLANVLAGRPGYDVTAGQMLWDKQDLIDVSPEERARLGLFLAFQEPVEIPGVSISNFLKASLNEIRHARGEEPLDALAAMKSIRDKAALVDLSIDYLSRPVNVGFSGGEKKRDEVLQMAVLEPRLAILDETDSGLDVDALKLVAKGVNSLRHKNNSFLVITHYQRILRYLKADKVHVMMHGNIVKSGGPDLAKKIETNGYEWLSSKKK